LRRNPAVEAPETKRLRRTGYLLAIGFGILTAAFVLALGGFLAAALLDPRFSIALAIPGSAWPMFLIPPLLVLIAIGMIMVAALQWRRNAPSLPGRVYFSLVTLCAIGCLILLGMQDLLLPPFL
jgi:hypothetical protein